MKNNNIICNTGSFYIANNGQLNIITFSHPFVNDNYNININASNGDVLSYHDKTINGFSVKYYKVVDVFNPIHVKWVAQESMIDISFRLRENPWKCAITFKVDNTDPYILTSNNRQLSEKEFSRWSKSSSNNITNELICKRCSVSEGRAIWSTLVSQGWEKFSA